MGLSRPILILSCLMIIVTISLNWNRVLNSRDSPSYFIPARYFGKDSSQRKTEETLTIERFTIPFDRSQVDDVLTRLRETRFSPVDIAIDHRHVNRSTYGFPHETAEMVRQYWMNNYDWKKTVKEWNEFQHYKTQIQGLNIHFVRVTDGSIDQAEKVAILLLHGWPGSFLEYLDVARLLNSSASTFHYDLIIPSLPGFGYSDAPVRPGLNLPQIAMIMHTLMERLGYREYVVCGGDWGSFIGSTMAQMYPKHVRGYLTTLIEPSPSLKNTLLMVFANWINPKFAFDADELEFMRKPFDLLQLFRFFWYEGGYLHLQATKPDTIGYALNDSPMGLAAYILEKWSGWTNDQSDIDRSTNAGLDRFTLDQLLSNVMLYWTTGSITSSMRIYFESVSSTLSGKDEEALLNSAVSELVPVAVVNYRHEISYTPRLIAKEKYPNIKLWTFHSDGGHFASIEKPKEYARDIQKFLLLL